MGLKALYIKCMKKQDVDYDIIVSGAGPAGLSFACAMAGSDLRIAVIDPAPEKVLKNPSYDGRETALTHLSEKILRELGVFDLIPADERCQMKRAHVVNGDDPYALKFDHVEAGADYLGTMVSNQHIRAALFAKAKTADDITLLDQRRISGVQHGDDRVTVTLDNDSVLSAALLVGADGRMSATRTMMGIKTSVKDLGRTCIVGVMEHSAPHYDTAFECFHYERTLAVLPLSNGRVSIVITLPNEKADDLLSMDDDAFARDIEERFDHRVGTMKKVGDLHAYPLMLTYASRFYDTRYAALGDAAVGMHPMTAHGYNLGLRGAYSLAHEIKRMHETGGDIGSPIVLRAYDRKHQLICKPMFLGTNILERIFTNETKPVKVLRRGLLRLGNIVKPANKLIMGQLTEKKHA